MWQFALNALGLVFVISTVVAAIGVLFNIIGIIFSTVSMVVLWVVYRITGVDLEEKFFPKVRGLGNDNEYCVKIWEYAVRKMGSEELASEWLDGSFKDYPGTIRTAVYNGYARLVWQDLMFEEKGEA